MVRGGNGEKQECVCSWKVTCFPGHLQRVLGAEGTLSRSVKELGTSDRWELFSTLAEQTAERELQITLEV